MIISFISSKWMDKNSDSIKEYDGPVPAVYPSTPFNAYTSITAENVDIDPDMLIHLFDLGTDSCADRSYLHENMFIQRER